MTMSKFMEKVTETYFESNCKVVEAIRITKKKLDISDLQLVEWFGRDISKEIFNS